MERKTSVIVNFLFAYLKLLYCEFPGFHLRLRRLSFFPLGQKANEPAMEVATKNKKHKTEETGDKQEVQASPAALQTKKCDKNVTNVTNTLTISLTRLLQKIKMEALDNRQVSYSSQ